MTSSVNSKQDPTFALTCMHAACKHPTKHETSANENERTRPNKAESPIENANILLVGCSIRDTTVRKAS